MYLVKFLVVPFLFLRQRFASRLCGFCYLDDFLQLAPLQGISSRVLVNWLVAHIQPELCSDLLQVSCLFFFFFFLNLFLDLYPLRNLVVIMALSVTYIRQGGILLLCHFLL